MISNRKQIENINFSLTGQHIARSFHHKFLGVFIDAKLKFHIHINKLFSEVSHSIWIMRVIKFFRFCIIQLYIMFHLCNRHTRINIQIYYSQSIFTNIKEISLITVNSNTNQLRMSPKIIKFEGVYDNFVLWKNLELFVNVNTNTLLKRFKTN